MSKSMYGRSVSIVGVGCTPFMYTLDSEEYHNITEHELLGYAALSAMEDAGIRATDVEYYFHGQASPLAGSNQLTPNIHCGNWFGMKGKGSIHHSEACCTGYLALEEAVNAVASGKDNEVSDGQDFIYFNNNYSTSSFFSFQFFNFFIH